MKRTASFEQCPRSRDDCKDEKSVGILYRPNAQQRRMLVLERHHRPWHSSNCPLEEELKSSSPSLGGADLDEAVNWSKDLAWYVYVRFEGDGILAGAGCVDQWVPTSRDDTCMPGVSQLRRETRLIEGPNEDDLLDGVKRATTLVGT